MPIGKRLTAEQKAEIIRLRIDEGLPVWGIAEKFDLCRDTVFKIIREWKKHGESAISEEEIRNELHDRTISEVAGDDHVCYEVTGDTDIEAYMADRKVKEPAPAATEASSKQEIVCENIPADIIPEKSENVKPDDDLLPCAVVDAIANEMDRLYDRLTECDREMQKIKDAREGAAKSLLELKAFLKKNGYGDVVKALDSGAKRRALTNESPNSL